MVNWHLSKQGIRWPVSRDHIIDRWPGTGCWLDRRLKLGQTLTPEHKRGLIFCALSVARRGYKAMLHQQKLLEKIFFLHFSLVSIQVWHNIAVVRTHWWLRSYSSQASVGYKLKAECLFLILLELLFFSVLQFLAYLWHSSDKVTQVIPGGPMSRTETKGLSERQRQRQDRIPVIARN